MFELTSVRHSGVNLKKTKQEAADYERPLSISFAAIYKCVSEVSPICTNNVYLTSNVCLEVESQGKQRGGKWEGRYVEEKGEGNKEELKDCGFAEDKGTKKQQRIKETRKDGKERSNFFFFFT